MPPTRNHPRRPGGAIGAPVAAALAAALAVGACAARTTDRPGSRGPLGRVDVLRGAPTALGIADVAAAPWAERFAPARPGDSLGFQAAPYWVRFELSNPAAEPRPCALTWDAPLTERLDLWIVGPDGPPMLHARGGLAVPGDERQIAFRGPHHAYALTLPAGARLVGYARAVTPGPALVALEAWDPAALDAWERHLDLLSGVAMGVVLLLIALAVPQLVASGDRTYAWYAAFVVSYGAYAATMAGLAPHALWSDAPGFALAAEPLFGALAGATGLAFARALLQTREAAPRTDRALAALAWANVAAAALAGFDVATANVVASALALPTLGAGLVAGVGAARRGSRAARWYVAAFGAFSVLGAAFALSLLGVLPTGPRLVWALHGGFALTGIALALALADRSTAGIRAARDALEQAVAERTRTLAEAVGALREEAEVRQRAERALRASEERFRVAFRASPDAVALSRASDGLFVAANDGFTAMTGWAEVEVIGRTALELGLWADASDRQRMAAALRDGSATQIDVRLRRKDGALLQGAVSARLVELEGVPHVLSVTRDMTRIRAGEAERRRLEEDLRQAQKMEAIGRLAGGVAHDFNNLLTGITTNVGLALMDAAPDDPSRPLLEEIERTARRAAGVTRQLLAFSRRQPLARQRVEPNALVTDLRRLLSRILGEEVRLEVRLGAAVPAVLADPGQLEQVLVNLVLNARDALGPGGLISVETAVGARRSGAGAGAEAPYAVVTVRDDGHGMDAATRARLFEPFFTTKGHGKGTGLGLSTAYGIVRNHGGFIEVDSEPERGSSFAVHLPAAPATSAEAAPAAPGDAAATTPGRGETVLVVEDEAGVREGIRNLLLRLGYRVLVATHGAEALAAAAAYSGPIHLLVTDVVMPEVNGAELARRLRAERPETRVLYVSGYDDGVLAQHGLEGGRADFLQKPFTFDALAERVRAMLAAREDAAA